MTTHADLQPTRLRLPAALIVLGAYLAATVVFGRILPDDAPEYVDTVFLAALALGLLLTAHLLGARRAVLVEPRRVARPWGIPLAVVALAIVVGFAISGGRMVELGAAAVLGIALSAIGVGVTEELMYRGVLLHGVREARVPEWAVMVVTSLVFGLTHLLNLASGAPLGPTLLQVAMATLSGAAFYLARRVSGTLLVPIALHVAWNLFLFIDASESLLFLPVSLIGSIGFNVAGIVAFVLVIREAAHGRRQGTSEAVAAR